ncbi:MAG: helix-turn-helix transcriptional regulator [Verrucomicrobiia bacterium]
MKGLLVNKATLAALLTCSVRKVDKLIEQKRIPVIRLGARCHRFDVADVLAALKGWETQRAWR